MAASVWRTNALNLYASKRFVAAIVAQSRTNPMGRAKRLGLYLLSGLLGFCVAHTGATLLLGDNPRATLKVFGAAGPKFGVEEFKQIVSSLVGIAVTLFTVWYRHASDKQRQRADLAVQQFDRTLIAVRKGLKEAGFNVDREPTASAEFAARIAVLEAGLAELKHRSMPEKEHDDL